MSAKRTKVGIREFREDLPTILKDVKQGQEVIVTKNGKPVATIIPTLTPTLSAAGRLPRIITLGSLKGGVGKTTLSMHLAAVLAEEGQDVIVVDADEESSALRWAQHAEVAGITLPFKVRRGEHNGLIRQARDLARQGHTVVIDTPPNNREILTRASAIADLILVPVLATGMDLDRLGSTLELLEDLEASREGLQYALVMNRVDGRKSLARAAKAELEELPKLDTIIPDRTEYEKVFGMSPSELTWPRAMWNEIKDKMGAQA
ncbi:type II toxin-antitoxin system prevent-host-death family antitoxin [Deinococcus enclensis]|uniref:Chromosome partitioning protein n=1 Tax=Deinococcus enclensis TaxID=1049582 RepID=A0ABT9MG43_9DEIO|nr:type II toxin-antitoxin system prevent-host-death family antitoxin [Deinococcus enclensis]MDP9765459.1 chromosome partitioning protein [Deinococcus enclensis]